MLAEGQLAGYNVEQQEWAPVGLLEKCVLLQTHKGPILIRILPFSNIIAILTGNCFL